MIPRLKGENVGRPQPSTRNHDWTPVLAGLRQAGEVHARSVHTNFRLKNQVRRIPLFQTIDIWSTWLGGLIWGVAGLAAGGAIGVVWGASEGDGMPLRQPDVWLHENWLRGLGSDGLDLMDSAAVFGTVFSRLPAEVMVWPTENYYYWQVAAGGRVLMGNIRLAADRRERGELAFAYGEPRGFWERGESDDRLAVNRVLTQADGVTVRQMDDFTVSVEHAGKTVLFHLNQLPQVLPAGFALGEEEVFLQRTQDESGLRFFLLYHRERQYFFWILDESGRPPENFRLLGPDVVEGRRTGFVFWIQAALGGRKVLASVRAGSLRSNDYHDGPFDQLADNFVRGDGLRPYLEEAMPWLRGRVDPRGNITDNPVPRRVALTVHGTHETAEEAVALIEGAKLSPDPIAVIAKSGMTRRAGVGREDDRSRQPVESAR